MLGALGGLRGWLGCGLFGLGWAVAGLAWRAGLGWGWLAGAPRWGRVCILLCTSLQFVGGWGLWWQLNLTVQGQVFARAVHIQFLFLILEDFGLIRLWDLGFTLMGSLIVIPE